VKLRAMWDRVRLQTHRPAVRIGAVLVFVLAAGWWLRFVQRPAPPEWAVTVIEEGPSQPARTANSRSSPATVTEGAAPGAADAPRTPIRSAADAPARRERALVGRVNRSRAVSPPASARSRSAVEATLPPADRLPVSSSVARPSLSAAALVAPIPPPSTVVLRSAPAAAPAAATERARHVAAINEVLSRYVRAYDALDANAAAAVWPSVDAPALARVFSRIREQDLEFKACLIDLVQNSATADCTGTLQYVPRVGKSALRTEHRSWQFKLDRTGEAWRIAGVLAR
jgi:hypothetical protein